MFIAYLAKKLPFARAGPSIATHVAPYDSFSILRPDCEPRINNLGLGADNVGREHPTESMIVGLEGCSIASRYK